MATLERGFKAWSERTSVAIRKELGLAQLDPLSPERLAEHLGILLVTPADIPGMPPEDLNQLLVEDPWGWSAASVEGVEGTLVIYNPNRSVGRKASDITHELAHVMLGHQPGTIVLSQDGSMAMRSFNQKQEDEANWLAWALLLPREAIVSARLKGLDEAAIASMYGVTDTLVRFRMRMTGVDLQFKTRRPVAVRKRAV